MTKIGCHDFFRRRGILHLGSGDRPNRLDRPGFHDPLKSETGWSIPVPWHLILLPRRRANYCSFRHGPSEKPLAPRIAIRFFAPMSGQW